MFELFDGRKYFWQWDANQKLVATTLPVGTEVHFYHKGDSSVRTYALRSDVEELKFKTVIEQEGGKRICKVPDKLLERAGTFEVYAYAVENPNARTGTVGTGNRTLGKKKFTVKPRPEPVR